VTKKEALVRGCFCVADGKNYAVQEPSASDLQNAYFNGWLHSVKVTGVLCYGFDGTLIWGRHNHPGSWNDGEMSRNLQYRLADTSKTMDGGCCATDSAFPVSDEMAGRIITPLKDGDLERASRECRRGLIAMSNAITCVRQSAEWGMGCASKCFRQLLLPLPYNPEKRRLRLSNIYHLYNLRVRESGISQIRSVFMPSTTTGMPGN
ncbi:DDE superfamily endonuclease, partial [Phytophthora infestans]